MAHFPPSVLSSLRKALAWLQLVWRRLATCNVLRRRVSSFVLCSLQFYTGLPCRPGVTAEKDQRQNAGCGTTPRLTGVNESNEPANILPSRLPTSTHTLLDPSSASDTSQEATPSARLEEPSPQNSTQHTSAQDTSSPPEPPSRVGDNRDSIPLTPMGFRQNSPQSTHLGEAPDSAQQLGLQFQHGEPVQLSSHQPHDQASIQPSLPDLLTSVKPAVPQQLKRYNRKFEINQIDYTQTIQPRRPDYPVRDSEVKGWHRRVHPEGAPYFASVSVGSGISVFTETDLSVPQHLRDVEDFSRALINVVDPTKEDWEDWALVLELQDDDVSRERGQLCFYYFINHGTNSIFWVHPVAIRDVCGNISVKSEEHLRYAIETHYWHHCEFYPTNLGLQKDWYLDVQQILIHANAESTSMLSDTPLGPFESDDLQKLLSLVSMMKDNVDVITLNLQQAREMDARSNRRKPVYEANALKQNKKENAHLVTILARVKRLFYQYRFLNFWGQFGARVGSGRPVFSRTKVAEEPVSWFLKWVDVALLHAPIAHLRGIQKICVDEMIDESRWKIYMSCLTTEWNGFTVYSTVMLAVDISFLTVPGVQAANRDAQSGAMIAIYASIISSVCVLIISVILAGQIRPHDVNSVDGGADYLVRMTRHAHGVEALAVMFSLPYSLLLWAMVFFILALGLVVFHTSDVLTLGTMIPMWGILILLALLPLWWRRLPSFAFRAAPPRIHMWPQASQA